MSLRVIPPLQVALALLLLGGVLLQVLTPLAAAELGGGYEETAGLVTPYAVAGIVTIACVQAAIVVALRLLSLVAREEIFTERALRLIGVMTAFMVAAAVVPALVMAHLLFVVSVGGPGVLIMFAACVVGGVALGLLMLVMRGLLTAAIGDRVELDGVI